MANTMSETAYEITNSYLEILDPEDLPTPEDISNNLVTLINDSIELRNAVVGKANKWPCIRELPPQIIAFILVRLYPVKRIAAAGCDTEQSYDLLGIYAESGENAGLYETDELALKRRIRSFNKLIKEHEIKEAISVLNEQAPRVERCRKKDLVAVNNGIFDFRKKQLLPFSPDYVFLVKSRVNYNPLAMNVTIHNPIDGTDWDVESWIKELFDDNQRPVLIWEILSAVVRPNVLWKKSAWFYSEVGNNGKGTLCSLMRNLIGEKSCASIPLSEMGKDFALEPLIYSSAIIVDENDVGTYIDKAANLKAIVTHDAIQINRKFKTPIAFKFYGFMVQCLNEFPRVKDKSDSFYRRYLFVPFDKSFTGRERKYIKDDYLKREEVLEYVLFRVLNMTHYELSEPDACKAALAEYKEYNDPVRQFVEELLPQCVWDLLPFPFLYDLYIAWFRKNVPSGSPQSKKTFTNDLLNAISGSKEWVCRGKNVKIRTSIRMNRPEPLLLEYELKDWYNETYRGNDPDKICIPKTKAAYRGLLRNNIAATITQKDIDDGNGDDDE